MFLKDSNGTDTVETLIEPLPKPIVNIKNAQMRFQTPVRVMTPLDW